MNEEIYNQLLNESKKNALYQKLTMIILAAILGVISVTAIVVVPKTLSALAQVETTLNDAQKIMGEVGTSLEQLSGAVEDINVMTKSITRTSESTYDKLDAIDFNKLDEAIENLRDAIEPLANFSRRLGG